MQDHNFENTFSVRKRIIGKSKHLLGEEENHWKTANTYSVRK